MKATHEPLSRIRAIVSEILEEPIAGITPEATLESLGADSLDVVEIQSAIEVEFDLPQINNRDRVKIRTVGDLVAAVRRATA